MCAFFLSASITPMSNLAQFFLSFSRQIPPSHPHNPSIVNCHISSGHFRVESTGFSLVIISRGSLSLLKIISTLKCPGLGCGLSPFGPVDGGRRAVVISNQAKTKKSYFATTGDGGLYNGDKASALWVIKTSINNSLAGFCH